MTNPESAQQDIEIRLREAHPNSMQRFAGSNILLEAADALTALRKQVEEAGGTLRYCEKCWAEERGTMIDKIQAERSRAEAAEAELAALLAENKRLVTTATDRSYMLQAYKAMLGPVALQLVKRWEDKGVHRQHTYWGPEAHKLTGEERAQVLLDAESAALSPLPSKDSKNGGGL